MRNYFSNLARLWRKSPLFALTHIRRKAAKSAKKILPTDDWNDWLGEEMRPFNSVSPNNSHAEKSRQEMVSNESI
jgi:hypothetical protein